MLLEPTIKREFQYLHSTFDWAVKAAIDLVHFLAYSHTLLTSAKDQITLLRPSSCVNTGMLGRSIRYEVIFGYMKRISLLDSR